MLRSLYSAVSGVKAHQNYLDVTGNNIANVNTVGFKRDVIQFRDMVYQTQKGASAPNAAIPIGGINPAQVGLGVKVGSIETMHTQGSFQSTGNPTDMAISGNGYFVVRNGGQQLFTRAGNFSLDRDGNLVMSGSGYMVQGYAYREQTDPATGNSIWVRDSVLSGINIPYGQKIAAKETTLAAFRCNLCSTTKSAISSLDNIPGGANKVLRPHLYDAYGAAAVTYVGDSGTPPAGGLAGETWYQPDTGKLMRYDASQTPPGWAEVRDAEPFETFYGTNTDTTGPETIFATGDTQYAGRVAKRARVDNTGNVPPTNAGTPPNVIDPPIGKVGQTYLDTATGLIYTTNSTGTAWDLTSGKAADPNTVYADMSTGDVYEQDPATPGQYIPMTGAVVAVLDATTNQIMTWNAASRSWGNVNDTKGLSPTGLIDPATGNPRTVTTQENMNAYAESIKKSHDHSTKMEVFDSLGNPYTMEVVFRKVLDRPADPNANPPTSAESEWDWYAYYVDSEGKQLVQYGEGAGTLVFGDDGLLKRTYYYEPTPATPDPTATPSTKPEYNWSIVEKIIDQTDPRYSSSVHDGLATGKVVADFNLAGAAGSVVSAAGNLEYASNMITLDFLGQAIGAALGQEKDAIDGVTQFGSATTTKGYYQDGYAMGELDDFTVGGDGVITGFYSNGQQIAISQIALATFANPQGLTKVGNTCFMASINSGAAQIGAPGTGGAGSIEGSTIEMSNVDLTEEFVNLIRAQRGFQANTRVVTTSDQVLEELINMKR